MGYGRGRWVCGVCVWGVSELGIGMAALDSIEYEILSELDHHW